VLPFQLNCQNVRQLVKSEAFLSTNFVLASAVNKTTIITSHVLKLYMTYSFSLSLSQHVSVSCNATLPTPICQSFGKWKAISSSCKTCTHIGRRIGLD